MELVAKNINKTIREKAILSNVSLCLKSGNVYGFVGKNGSGKTMLFRALSGLMKIDSGSIVWEEKILHKDFSVLPSLGIIIENAGLYPNFTGIQNLTYLANLTKRIGQEEIIQAITRVGLNPYDKRLYGKYSLGMKQRLAIAQAIMEKPDVIMLDEPTNALDETGVEEIRKIILEEKARGALILVASHNKEDIQVLSDEWYRVENGQVIKQEASL
ncbi:ABC transporter ATP-binding protein [Acetivibrio ethanolgignens]|uniref:Multidrug ABC transporter ATP-binding protein n=1 Tax=Acetivibrio ethanolgignens TaxID=290052 RepID=A0A0V8QH52_9FIRM|nr:ATP-binding cassette domain-containing protein [Acetivibrio ethanolgignens]KSV59879.1 multidrug ABC transporter ATP-binding protein [Acetivibrio ethanolgignens]